MILRGRYRFTFPLAMMSLFLCLSGVLASPVSVEETRLFDLLNQARRENKLPVLRWNPKLATVARRHSDLMADHNELSHGFSGESSLAKRTADADVRFSAVAENVGLGPTPEVIHDLLMKSSGHRANILDPVSNEVGIAIVRRSGSLFAVQDFAHVVADLDARQQTALVAGLLQKEGYSVIKPEPDVAPFCDNDNGPTLANVTKIFRYETADLGSLPDALREIDLKKTFHNAAVASCKSGRQTYRMVVVMY